VWRLDADRALVVTADFITPLVDDAATWGRIAAANAASDVYAMGGRPLLGLNLVGWNRDELPLDLLGDVLAGAAEVAADGGFVIAGGHTVDDPEPKFGLAVVGEAHPDRLLTNAGFRPGQVLVLTKALGVGVVATAIKADRAPVGLIDEAVASMCRLNDDAATVASGAGATGATDVTGFGLLGHLGRAAAESGVDAEVDADAVPLFAGVRALAEAGLVPGGSRRNLAWVADRLDAGTVDGVTVLLLADAQTSGGLVFGVDPAAADGAVARLRAAGHPAAAIGRTREGTGRIVLR
jgi:selenide,water dikinase